MLRDALTTVVITVCTMYECRAVEMQAIRTDWFLRDWMDALGVRQVDMISRAGWSKTTASLLYTGIQSYSPKLLNEAAGALGVRTFELLMRPSEAMALRRLRESAEAIFNDSSPAAPSATTPAVHKGAVKSSRARA